MAHKTDPNLPAGMRTQEQGNGDGILDGRAARMLRDGAELRASDPELFASVLRQLLLLQGGEFATARSDQKAHPLAAVLGTRKDDPIFDTIIDNARQIREESAD